MYPAFSWTATKPLAVTCLRKDPERSGDDDDEEQKKGYIYFLLIPVFIIRVATAAATGTGGEKAQGFALFSASKPRYQTEETLGSNACCPSREPQTQERRSLDDGAGLKVLLYHLGDGISHETFRRRRPGLPPLGDGDRKVFINVRGERPPVVWMVGAGEELSVSLEEEPKIMCSLLCLLASWNVELATCTHTGEQKTISSATKVKAEEATWTNVTVQS